MNLSAYELLIVSKYLTENDIFKLKYVNSKFKELQLAMLTNFDNVFSIKHCLIKYPNAQTINVTINEVFILDGRWTHQKRTRKFNDYIINIINENWNEITSNTNCKIIFNCLFYIRNVF